MSYILDALKKSEAEREALGMESGVEENEPQRLRPTGRKPWGWIGAGVVALIGSWLGYHMLQSPQKPSPVAARQVAEKETKPVVAGPLARPAAPPASMEASTPPSAASPAAQAAMPKPAVQPWSMPATPRTASQTVGRPASTTATAPALSAPKVEKPVPQPAQAEHPDATPLNALPANILSSLPEIVIEAHIYDADPASRMAIINGQLHREGDTLGNGLELREITEKGVVLSFRGTLFSMNTMQSWKSK